MTRKILGESIRRGRYRPRSEMTRLAKAILLLSVPIYAFLTLVLAVWLPQFPFLALIPIVFAAHSVAGLIRGIEP
jgi:hypothetical protein